MNSESASKLSVADIRAFGYAEDPKTLEALLGRLATLAMSDGHPGLYGWLCSIREMPEEIAEQSESARLETAHDAFRQRCEYLAANICAAAISVLHRP